MAINPATRYLGQITPATTNYPYGSARDVSSPGAGDGTPVQQAWVNDQWGFLQALLSAAAITPSGNPDTAVASQYLTALQTLFLRPSDFAFTKTTPLSVTLPGGLILKAGSGTTSSASAPITFGTAFPGACVAGGILSAEEATNDYVLQQCVARSVSGLTFAFYRAAVGVAPAQNTLPVTYSWFAIGY